MSNAFGYPQMTTEQCHAYAMKVQREWHYLSYPPQERVAIRARVEQFVTSNPNSYLARTWRQVYAERP